MENNNNGQFVMTFDYDSPSSTDKNPSVLVTQFHQSNEGIVIGIKGINLNYAKDTVNPSKAFRTYLFEYMKNAQVLSTLEVALMVF